MNEQMVEENIRRLQKEFRIAGSSTDERLLDLRVELDRMRLEMTALKQFLATVFPSFAEQFPQILSRTIEEVDPESN